MKNYILYFLYRIFLLLFSIMPKFLIKQILLFCTFFAYKLDKKHKHIANVNLDLAFNNKLNKTEKNNIIYNSYKNLVFNMYEIMKNQNATKDQILSKMKVQNEHFITSLLKENKKIILITAHYGNWEIGVPYFALKYSPIVTVGRKMNNPHIHKLYENIRKKNNITMFDKYDAAKNLIKALKEDKIVALMIDQHTPHGSDVDFLHVNDTFIDVSSRLALRFNAVILPVFAITNDFEDYTLKFYPPIDCQKINFSTQDKIKQLTQIQADIISKQITSNPNLWLWQHKRWKKNYNDLYKKG